MKYLVLWLICSLAIIVLMIPLVLNTSMDTTEDIVPREAVGFDLNVNDTIYLIQITGLGTFTVSED